MTLKDAFDQEKFVIDDAQYTDDDLQSMSLDDLDTLRMRINKKISGLSAFISTKKMEYANGGKGTTTESYMRYRSALSINQRVLTYVNYLIKKRNRTSRTIADCFMNQAKTVLSQEDFDLVLSNAKREMQSSEGELR
jgi:hypothetical protein